MSISECKLFITISNYNFTTILYQEKEEIMFNLHHDYIK